MLQLDLVELRIVELERALGEEGIPGLGLLGHGGVVVGLGGDGASEAGGDRCLRF